MVIQIIHENMKHLLFVIFLISALLTAGCMSKDTTNAATAPQNVTVYFFYGEECPHCHNVLPFIQNLSTKYPDVDFVILETWHNETNNALFTSFNQKLGLKDSGVPEVIVAGNATPLIGDRDIPAYLEAVILEQLNKKQ
jgi:thiol-disulfide isomerase/thioredoxin